MSNRQQRNQDFRGGNTQKTASDRLVDRAYRCGARGQKLSELKHAAQICGPYYIYMRVKALEADAIARGRFDASDA